MILNNKSEEFNYRFVARVGDYDSILFATSCTSCRNVSAVVKRDI